jgi:murein DD-endopeptidase MepM/ murein hydrolase activator NlpD
MYRQSSFLTIEKYRWPTLVALLLPCLIQCGFSTVEGNPLPAEKAPLMVSYKDSLIQLFENHPDFYADGFDFPVGKPDAKGYYNAQPFTQNNHLGDDWNGNKGGNTDFGDPVSSVANGYVTQSINYMGGWGKIVRVVHVWKADGKTKMVESLYAHLDKMTAKKGQWIHRGDAIGTIGNNEGQYLAHLHLEIREEPGMEIGGGYSSETKGYLDPTVFIRGHRGVE